MNGVIQAVQEPELALTSNTASVPFQTVDLRTRSALNCACWMNHNEGSALFSLLAGGIYEVTFNSNITSATARRCSTSDFLRIGVLVPRY